MKVEVILKNTRFYLARWFLIVAAMGLNLSDITSSKADTIPQLVAKAKPATIQIIASDENWSPIKTGTGFFISPDGVAVTNFHVIQGASHLAARTNEGAVFQFQRVLAHPQDVDLAILKFAANGAAFLKLGQSTNAVEGQRVLVIGSPEGLQGTVSDGIISAFRENRSMIQITAPISPGSSGSPVMNESGEVIGVATMVTKEGQNLGFAIPAEEVERALVASRDQPMIAPALPDPQPWFGFETPSEPPQVDVRSSVLAFVKNFWSHSASNDPGDWASDFAPRAGYCYSDSGLADRGFVRYDRAKLVERYPVRHYKFFDPNIQMSSSGNSAQVTFSFSYSYAGRRSAAGFSRVSLTVQNIAGRWLISDYDEKVDRQ
jgi:hypothetical protein